uniref:Galectin n=1 Tax=Panagrolaimus sp. ES5 TaxID=591445 RepID=A0AC34F070_9BILA
MAIINEYKAAKSYYANPKKYWYLMTCGKDGSCSDIGSDPVSFDYELWPKVKKPAAKVVENTITVMNLWEGETLEFVSQIQKTATQVWIRLDLMNAKGVYKKFKIIFGIPKQQYQMAGKKWKSAKAWSTKLTRGSNLTISIQSKESTFEILANGNNLGYTISKSVGSLGNVVFGGNWIPKKILRSDKLNETPKTFAPKFTVFQPTNVNVACKPSTIKPSAAIKYKDILKQLTQNGTISIPLLRNSMTGYGHEIIELRESLCQNSDIALIEIGAWKQGKDGKFRIYVEMWSRRFNEWNDRTMANIDSAQCKNYQITVDNYYVNFICDGTKLVSLEYGSVYFSAKSSIAYIVEQTQREIVCNK